MAKNRWKENAMTTESCTDRHGHRTVSIAWRRAGKKQTEQSITVHFHTQLNNAALYKPCRLELQLHATWLQTSTHSAKNTKKILFDVEIKIKQINKKRNKLELTWTKIFRAKIPCDIHVIKRLQQIVGHVLSSTVYRVDALVIKFW